MSQRSVVLGSLLLLLASPVWAATAAEHGTNWPLLGLQVLNTAVLVLILLRFTRRPIRDFLLQRSHRIRRQIDAAETRLREAETEIEQLRRRLVRFEEEKQEIIARSGEQAEAERAQTLERVRATAERIREEARRVADQEIERARQVLQSEAAELAVSLARDLLREQLTLDDDRRLLREYVNRLGGTS
ncbi:MAG: ATP synthase F0 subunit B [Deltaproteobacteria bacterium]|nr:ATP synthase F0 subunit B [Deltaproteobacteria bacterium]